MSKANPHTLPEDVGAILRILGNRAELGIGLPKRDVDDLKRDLMKHWVRWRDIPVEVVEARCVELGMSAETIVTIIDLLQRRKNGARFNPRGGAGSSPYKAPPTGSGRPE